eukprot:15154387-Ditylum_brightwellii.AAC.1
MGGGNVSSYCTKSDSVLNLLCATEEIFGLKESKILIPSMILFREIVVTGGLGSIVITTTISNTSLWLLV